jgi:hypothetical protein
MDPNLVQNTKNQMDAKKQSQQSYGSKVTTLTGQIQAIENEKVFLKLSRNKTDQAISTKIKVTVLILVARKSTVK